MAASSSNSGVQRFGVYEFDPRAGELRKQGIRIRLEGQPLAILRMLLDRPGELVTREDLQKKLWPADTFVDFEHSLNSAIKRLRAALNDSASAPRYIETLAGRGYRFIAVVERVERAESFTPVQQSRLPMPWFSSKSVWLIVLGLSALTVILFAANVGNLRNRTLAHGAPPRIRSLAVLPLTNLSGNPDEAYFANGMTEALISQLVGISALKVTSRTSVMRYKDSTKPVKEIARELGVGAIVEGTVLRSNDKVRITAQLIDARTGSHLLSRTYEGGMRDVLALQSSVATAIADQIRIQILPGERAHLSIVATVNPRAYEAYLKGRYLWNKRTQEGLRKAMEYFQQAVDQDPAYAPAYAGLADTYGPLTNWGWLAPREAMPKAKAAGLKALEIDDRLAEAHVSVGMVTLVYDWDWPAAGKHFERALALNPAYPAAHQWYANYLMALGRSDEALAEAKRAVDLDRVSPDNTHHLAWLLNMVGRFDEAIQQERKTLEMDPEFPPCALCAGGSVSSKGDVPRSSDGS